MARFFARQLKNGQIEIKGIDGYVRSVISQLLRHFRPAAKASSKASARRAFAPDATVQAVIAALAHHPKRQALVRAGKQKDQLLRSLIPLYIARKAELHLSSGAISRFWAVHGVKYAPPNAAKALRQHVGYARLDAKGRQITPNGIRYVEAALSPAKQRNAA